MARGVRRNGGGQGVFLLAATILQIGAENIPPITLGLVAGQTAIFLGCFPQYFPSSTLSVCMSSYLVLTHRDWKRLVLGTFTHGSDMHLYFNMASLIYKGIKLERKFGSLYFAYLVTLFSGLTSLVYVGLGQVLSEVLQDQSYSMSCAVGFSGVLFALKVLATEYSEPGTQYAFGVIPVPSKYIFWAELVLIQVVTPNASFVGHLAGILVGLAYTRGPLRVVMDAFLTPGDNTPGSTPQFGRSRAGSPLRGRGSPTGSRSWTSRPASAMSWLFNMFNFGHTTTDTNQSHTPRFSGRGAQASTPSGNSQDYTNFTGGLSEEEQTQRVMRDSQAGQGDEGGSQRLYPDLEEVRRRRAMYYQNR